MMIWMIDSYQWSMSSHKKPCKEYSKSNYKCTYSMNLISRLDSTETKQHHRGTTATKTKEMRLKTRTTFKITKKAHK
jgi:hypothetical protein